jgi:hypothetical protein
VLLLAGMPLLGQSTPLGVVTQSNLGHLNNSVASVGTTIFNADRLFTEVGGSLGLRSGLTQIVLSEDSAILINQEESTVAAVLQRGSVSFTVESGGAFRLIASDVRVRPQSSELTAGQMTLESCAVVVTSRTQALEVTAGKETKIVEAGQSYRVAMEDGNCGKRNSKLPVAAGVSRFDLIPLIAGGITIWGLHKVFVSPDRP